MEEELYKIYLKNPVNLFDEFISTCEVFYNLPSHSLSEIKKRDSKKLRWDIFENFCVLYLKHIKKYENVYLLKDVPDEILQKLHLKRRDMGIDIIIQDLKGNFYAVQCKYKKYGHKKFNILSWKVLSTFYALCLRSGPWKKYIVMTTADSVKREGLKTEKDKSYCINSFRNISKDDWLKMCNLNPKSLNEDTKNNDILTKEELRNLRLKKFQNI